MGALTIALNSKKRMTLVVIVMKLLIMLGYLSICSADQKVLTRELEGRLEFPNSIPFNITTRITLNNGEYTTYSRIDGSLVILNPKGTYQYFEAKRGFSIFSLLKNPMVIMMLFSVGLMVLMPKMMEGLEPEEKAR